MIQVQESITAEESITLTIDVGSLPLDTSLAVSHEPVALVDVHDEYTQYEFTMPYHDVRITIVDETGSK